MNLTRGGIQRSRVGPATSGRHLVNGSPHQWPWSCPCAWVHTALPTVQKTRPREICGGGRQEPIAHPRHDIELSRYRAMQVQSHRIFWTTT